jgi:hypothetical protein
VFWDVSAPAYLPWGAQRVGWNLEFSRPFDSTNHRIGSWFDFVPNKAGMYVARPAAPSARVLLRRSWHRALSSSASAPKLPLHIGGKRVDSAATQWIPVHNPATQEVVCQVLSRRGPRQRQGGLLPARTCFPLLQPEPATGSPSWGGRLMVSRV